MSEQDYRSACLQLRAENEILRAEKEDAEEREASLKRQMEIMSQLGSQESHPASYHSLAEEVERLRGELVAVLGEKEQVELASRTFTTSKWL